MRPISIAVVVALVGCAQTSRDPAPRTPEEIESEIEVATVNAENPPPDTATSRMYIDEKIVAACGLTLPQAFFEFDSAALDADNEHELQAVAECLDDGPLKDTRVGVIGNADPRGTGEINEGLGLERAESVADYLARHGVERDRVQTASAGELFASVDPEDWPANRRVDIILRSAPN